VNIYLFAPIALACILNFWLAFIEKRKPLYLNISVFVLVLACLASYVAGSNTVCYAPRLFLKHNEEYRVLSATPYSYDTGIGSPKILTVVIYAEKPFSVGVKNVSLEVDASTVPIGTCKWDDTTSTFKPVAQ
jgi:hypothetical protein